MEKIHQKQVVQISLSFDVKMDKQQFYSNNDTFQKNAKISTFQWKIINFNNRTMFSQTRS